MRAASTDLGVLAMAARTADTRAGDAERFKKKRRIAHRGGRTVKSNDHGATL
jgi:hypothetical protein